MNKISKRIASLFVLVALVVVVIAGIGYYAYKNIQTKTIVQTDPNSPSLSDTWKDQITSAANWKTHTDLKWEYQVSYPEDWGLPKESYPVSDYTVEFTSSDRVEYLKLKFQEHQLILYTLPFTRRQKPIPLWRKKLNCGV